LFWLENLVFSNSAFNASSRPIEPATSLLQL
jgi:hypothetical protein